MPRTSRLYRALSEAAVRILPLALRGSSQRAAHAGRLGAPAALTEWSVQHRDTRRPLAWFHAPSVGEGLQARAVIQAWRAHHPDAQVIYTHFSPSAAALAASIDADWSGYLPYDRPGDVAQALAAAKANLLVFTKLDLWPTLATRACAMGTRVAMVAGTVSPDSSRLRWPVRTLAAPGYHALDVVGAIAAADAARLVELGCAHDRIVITGDPRFDSAIAVADEARGEPPLVSLGDPARVLVAGSTWPGDEVLLLQAFAEVRRRHTDARLMLVPHQPTLTHLLKIESFSIPGALRAPVLLGLMNEGDEPEILVVDRLGMLSRLYAAGSMAYVGGGFGRAGIHSVLEPAAWGRPVIIGPNDRGSRDAAVLAASGGLVQLPREQAREALVAQWNAWLDDPAGAIRAGAAGRAAMEPDRGAAERSAVLLGI